MIDRKSAYDMLRLIKSVISADGDYDFSFTDDELSGLYKTAEKHSLCAITADALEKRGFYSERFHEAKAKAVRKCVLTDVETDRVCDKLAENKINFVRLKGAVLKNYYPKKIYREMVDVDILVDPLRRDDIKRLMEELGYKTARFGTLNDDVYQKEELYCYEMHSSLFDKHSNKLFYDYYSDVFDRLNDSENTAYEKRFSDEDFYIYMMIHIQKHFCHGGAGLKYLLDIYLFLKCRGSVISWDTVQRETKKLGLNGFEELHRTLAQKVFDNQSLSEEETALLDDYLMYGAHGSFAHYVSMRTSGDKNKSARYIIKRAFPSADDLPEGYSFFSRHKAMLPALWVYRLAKAAVCYPSVVTKELKAVKRARYENHSEKK